MSEHLDNDPGKLLCLMEHREPGPMEYTLGIMRCFAIHSQAEDGDPLAARFRNRLSSIFDAVVALVDVDVVRLAVG